ncbi:uncharacterized protein CDV56_105060 [Aspergillus thermomutatus]|uniref:chitinase n=1 Tax=Aspergillus thermomutatus TaxID=41047 RepID=A0A397HNQ2_ASPTH|nr:uncharacterized protein CDV56_105060 [Aspergillus thermomutatus]RHZ63588.1 hypothetical protein CDV56_105060 [Aspergillus thermomutatus]
MQRFRAVCQGSCNATAECGKYAPKGSFDCPLNVCCSKWGYCGTTDDFCNDECQNENGCLPVLRPECSASDDAMALDVRIGYYGLWAASRGCDNYLPENIPAGALTHINLAFEYVSEGHEITDAQGQGPIVARVSRLKKKYPGLRVNIALGGWVFNDPPTQHRFSDMASTVPNRQKFIASLIRYIRRYGLNGVDIDWEYPVADDRGGSTLDYDNFVLLCADIREAFDREDPGWQLTITLPASYWYLRGFNLNNLEKYVDWFNVMTYDIHGIWDQKNVWTGPYLKGHTNLTEIEQGLDLLWRNGVSSHKVVMGFGFYGRSFTISDLSCTTPPTCTFDSAGFAGECTNETGILSYSEVISKEAQLGSKTFYDEASSVKWMVYGSNQWISFDDEQSFTAKKKYLTSRCLKGLMIWSIDLDTQDHQAMTGLFGEAAMEGALRDTGLDPEEAEQLASDLSAWTGELCYTTPTCTDGSRDQRGPDQVCQSGYTAVEMAHAPVQKNGDFPMHGECAENWWRYICCPTKAMPQNCGWVGAPERSASGCDRGCGASQFELNYDTYIDAKGQRNCYTGERSLCCDSTEILNKCHWTGCDLVPVGSQCGSDEVSVGMRYDDDKGGLCGTAWMGAVRDNDRRQYREFCCPKSDAFANCDWAIKDCNPGQCPKNKLEVTTAQTPSWIYDNSLYSSSQCYGFQIPEMMSPDFKLCCDPPSRYNEKWPVEPKYLWSHYYDDAGDDVTWEFSDNFGNNNKDTRPDDMEDDPGTDPYGFVMLDGPPGSINNAFGTQYTVVTRDEPVNVKKRSIVTTNQTIMDAVFDHSEETVLVYCNYPADSKECRQTFYKGAEDTIIRLPDHIGEGPWARVVSMVPVEQLSKRDLPEWAIQKRDASENQNGIYSLTFDYNFHLIKRDDEQVNIRVDYTNLLPYWDEMTNSPASTRKRSTDEALTFSEWKVRVDRAKVLDTERSSQNHTGRLSVRSSDSSVHRRWWGVFVDWVKKMTTVTKTDGGMLPMGLVRSLVLYSGRLQCSNDAGITFKTGLDITADFNMEMNARYSYYFSGTVVPPTVTDMFAYVGVHPRVYAGVGISGNAELNYPSERKKIIDTLTYPGLAIKGIAAVGPTMDLWGQISGGVTVSGDLRVGMTYQFKPVELYFPNDDEVSNNLDVKDMEEAQVNNQGLEPSISGNVRAAVDINIDVTPEINLGIKIGGGIGPLKGTLADAHVSAFANTTLNFHAEASGALENGNQGYSFGYSVNFLYRFGFGCVAEIYKYGKWTSGIWYPFPQNVIPIISKTFSSLPSTKRSLDHGPLLSEEPLPGAIFGVGPERHRTDSAVLDLHVDPYPTYGNASLEKRQDSPQSGKEPQFTLGSFRCTTSTGSVCEAFVPSESMQRRDLIPMPEDTHELQKRETPTDCKNRIPRLYYNCVTFFSDVAFQGPAGTAQLSGICTNVRKFLDNNNRPNDGYTLTWESSNQEPRRRQVCKSGACAEDNANYRQAALGTTTATTTLTSCDEFPFASTEEGGADFLGVNPEVKTGTVRTCVPKWQNDCQGMCHNLLNNLETNVEYFNTYGSPTLDNAHWVRWNNGGWTRKGGLGGRQRLSTYGTTRIPKTRVPGLNHADQVSPDNLGYYHKRNFTLFLSYPRAGQNPDSQWPDQSFTRGTITGKSGNKGPATDVVGSSTWVICAVNTMGQQRYQYAGANGMCTDGRTTKKTWDGLYDMLVYYQCKISFTGSAGPTKRDNTPLGYLGGDPYYSIERVEGTERTVLLPKDWDGQELRESWVVPDSEDLEEGDFTEEESG